MKYKRTEKQVYPPEGDQDTESKLNPTIESDTNKEEATQINVNNNQADTTYREGPEEEDFEPQVPKQYLENLGKRGSTLRKFREKEDFGGRL